MTMMIKRIALFFFVFAIIYGHGALAALPTSCEDEGTTSSCKKCTPLNSEFEPPGVGQVWFSQCCTESETTTADPPVTTTKKYCFSYYLSGYPNNLFSGHKPSCSENGSGNSAWSLYGQCQTDAGVSYFSSFNFNRSVIHSNSTYFDSYYYHTTFISNALALSHIKLESTGC